MGKFPISSEFIFLKVWLKSFEGLEGSNEDFILRIKHLKEVTQTNTGS